LRYYGKEVKSDGTGWTFEYHPFAGFHHTGFVDFGDLDDRGSAVIIRERLAELTAYSGDAHSPGVHVSAIISDFLDTLHGKRYADSDETARQGQFEKGFVWERLLSAAFAKRVDHPGEIELDGILGSPDALEVNEDGDLVVDEYKATLMSAAVLPEAWADKRREWLMQTQSYCHMLGLDTARFHILHLCGDYRENRAPIYRVWELTYSALELAENWRTIVNHARHRGLIT